MRVRPAIVGLVTVMIPACSVGSSDQRAGSDEQDVRVAFDDLIDLDDELPEGASGVDLGTLAPPDDLDFCDAVSQVPMRWVDDAVVPIQVWTDTYAVARDSVPPAAAEPLDALLDHGRGMLAWHFGSRAERPVFGATLADAAVAVVDVGVETCPVLPIVIGRDPSSISTLWSGDDASEISARCDEQVADMRRGVDWFRDETGRPPGHQQQIEALSLVAYLRSIEESGSPDFDLLHFPSDVVGVAPDGSVTAVPGGPCDR